MMDNVLLILICLISLLLQTKHDYKCVRLLSVPISRIRLFAAPLDAVLICGPHSQTQIRNKIDGATDLFGLGSIIHIFMLLCFSGKGDTENMGFSLSRRSG